MRKVSGEVKRSDIVQQLPLYSEREDLPGNEDPSGRITAEQAQTILKEHGLEVSPDQASAILCFLRRLVALSLTQIFKK
jgi:hypothetical protein